MNIKSHLNKIKIEIIDSLLGDKKYLISNFDKILSNSSNLLQSDELTFWQNQIRDNQWDLIPITKYGISQELNQWKTYNPKLNTLLNQLKQTSQNILLYWVKDDLCDKQGQYYYT